MISCDNRREFCYCGNDDPDFNQDRRCWDCPYKERSGMIKIVHASDWHAALLELPVADLYIVTGDMLPNFPVPVTWDIVPSREREHQNKWIDEEINRGTYRRLLGNKDAPVVVVRGNHDFVNYGRLFGGEVFEINEDSTRTVNYCGLKIGGFRGVPSIDGRWCDELSQVDRLNRVNSLPASLDVVVSHAPPKGILSAQWGCTEYTWLVNRWLYEGGAPLLCCFGHIHEKGGLVETHGGTKFSNASYTYNTIELEQSK